MANAHAQTFALPTFGALQSALLEPLSVETNPFVLVPLDAKLVMQTELRANAALGLVGGEARLAQACVRALGLRLNRIEQMTRETRVSLPEAQKHAREIGVTGVLTDQMLLNVQRFAQFVRLLEKLDVLGFEVCAAGSMCRICCVVLMCA
jgi:hypothetical protein